MREVHSEELQAGSLMPGLEAGKGWGVGGVGVQNTNTHFDVNSLPRAETLAPGSVVGACQAL